MMSETKISWLLFLFLVYFNFTYTTIFAQEVDEYLLWANVSNFPNNSGAIVNQSDLDVDRNLYVIGSYFKVFPGNPDPTETNSMLQIFIRKYDRNGNLLWSKEFGTESFYSYAGDIRVDKQGDIVFTGYLYDLNGVVFGQPVSGFFLAKMDNNGTLNWITPFSKTSLWTWGERIGVYGKQSKLEIDMDNSIVLYSNGNPVGSLPNPSSGLYISRYSSAGNLIHQYQITHGDNFDSPMIGGLAIDKDGNFIVTGYYHVSLQIGTESFGIPGPQNNTPVQLFLAKFSSTGVFLWAKVVDGMSTGADVEVDDFGNIYLTGSASGHAILGGSVPLNSSDFYDAFIAKLNANGKTIWSNLIEGGRPTSLKRTTTGDLYISGTCYYHLGYNNYILERPELEESFVLKVNADASFGGALVSDGVPLGVSFKIAINSSIDDDGNIYTVGNFNQRIVFGCDTLYSDGDDLFITKYSSLPPAYTMEIIGPTTLCSGATLSLSATAIPEPVKYFWTLPPGVTATNQVANQIMTSVPATAKGREIDVMIRKGCYNYQSSGPYKINIDAIPGPVEALGQQVYCNPGTTHFNCTLSMDASSYVWELPIGIAPKLNTLVTFDPYIEAIIADDFNEGVVIVKARNECFDGEFSEGLKIQLIKAPSPISFLNSKDEFCNQGQPETFEVTKSEGALEYLWKIPPNMKEAGTFNSTSNSIQLTLMNAGVGLLSVYAKNSCHQTDEISYPIKITNPLTEPKILKSNCDLELTTDGIENIEWYKDAQKFDQGATTIAISEEGEYYVTVTNFCGTVASPPVAVNPLFDDRLFIPNVITPNGDGKNDMLTINTNVSDISLELFNRWGKSVYENTNYINDWDGSGLDAGVYYLQVKHSCLKQKHKGWLQIIK